MGNIVNWAIAMKPIAEVLVLLATPLAAVWTICTYQRSVKLERAKWVKDLYDKFYEHSDLKAVRDLLDSDDDQQIRSMVAKEGPGFTDYLNFFEFLGYLWESKQIKGGEILGLFEYYLKNLKRNEAVAAYIADPTKGFEKIQKLLKMVEEAGCR